jgi:hypothetical protein
MQVSQVQRLSLGLEGIAKSRSGDIDIVQYRGWFSKDYTVLLGLMPQREYLPYLLTFESYPPATKDQCLEVIKERNVTEPNRIAEIMAMEGVRPTRLVQMRIDENYMAQQAVIAQRSQQYSQPLDTSLSGIQPDAYGLGVHANQYGQPVKLRPDWGYVPGEPLQINENAYGLGVHSDQYGRPVREYPAFP